MISLPTLREAIAQYALERGRKGRSLENLHHTLNALEKTLGRPATWHDLTTEALIAWGTLQQVAGLDPETIRGRRTQIVGIWKWGHEAGYIDHLPGRLPKIKVPEKPPRCWDIATELPRLIAAAKSIPGRCRRDRRILRAQLAEAWVRADYCTGLRFADLHGIHRDQIGADGSVLLVQAKTGHTVLGHLDAAALAAVRTIMRPERELVFEQLINRRNLQGLVRQVVKAAGLEGSTKWLRRTGATWIEVQTPGAAMAFLGHKTPGLAYKHYVDPRFTGRNRPQPPPIG